MEITIIADNRERSSGIPQLLISRNIKTKTFQLVAGDYIINDSIVIERKTKTDFIQSIINGRLFAQCERMKKTGLIP
jgi:ERCC4-type nuclease